MYVCVCQAVNEHQLRQLVREGAESVRAVNRCCGLGGRCGRCVPYARAVIADECTRNTESNAVVPTVVPAAVVSGGVKTAAPAITPATTIPVRASL